MLIKDYRDLDVSMNLSLGLTYVFVSQYQLKYFKRISWNQIINMIR